MNHSYERYLDEVLIPADELQARIRALGEQITQDYAEIDNLHLICVLKGGVMFLADLTRCIDVPHSIDFMAISSYGAGVRESSGRVRIEMDLSHDIAGKNILIVEDIVDSGHTLDYMVNLLSTRSPESIRICTLLSKPSRRQVTLTLDYVGFEIPDKFVFGYGLDLDELFRNLPFVGVCKAGLQIGES